MDGVPSDPAAGVAGQGGTPLLELNGFSGPLEALLMLARAQQVDLGGLSLRDLVDQLNAALQHAAPTTPLGRKADWVVMAAWLMLLRSRLMLPADAPAQLAAKEEADQLRDRLVALQEAQALAVWLDRRPLLGRDVFVRGQPELAGTWSEFQHEPDVIAFLWASLALFDDDAEGADTASVYRPRWLDLYSVPEARDRILRLLAETPAGQPLDRCLPPADIPANALRRRSAWTSTFAASLELTRQGDVVLAQEGDFAPIHVRSRGGLALPGAQRP